MFAAGHAAGGTQQMLADLNPTQSPDDVATENAEPDPASTTP